MNQLRFVINIFFKVRFGQLIRTLCSPREFSVVSLHTRLHNTRTLLTFLNNLRSIFEFPVFQVYSLLRENRKIRFKAFEFL